MAEKAKIKSQSFMQRAKEVINNIFVNVILLSILAFAIGISYLKFNGFNKLLPGYEKWAKTLIEVGIFLMIFSIFILNIGIVKKAIFFLIRKLAMKLKKRLTRNRIKSNLKKPAAKTVTGPITEGKEIRNTKEGYPPLSLLTDYPEQKEGKEQLLKQDLIYALQKYELDQVKIKNVHPGPSITRFILDIGDIKITKVTAVEKEIAMTMEADSISIKPTSEGLVVEIPNKIRTNVYHKDVFNLFIGKGSSEPLEIPIGKTATGELLTLNVAKCPHLLIAGQTGGGKSVCINTIIISFLLKSRPEEVQFILIDPKVVELSAYNGIPHLLMPVVTEADEAARALSWAVKEMEGRYRTFAKASVRDIGGYNSKPGVEKLPHIVVVIDELADLMLVAKEQIEESIQRLGQLARAAGIHLITATQRPSSDIITGIIKANIPARMAFVVASGVDSRVILDASGAEKLLGDGDGLLHTTQMRNPLRFQGSFISDKEVENVINWWKNKDAKYDYEQNLVQSTSSEEEYREDEIKKYEEYDETELKVRIYLSEIAYGSNREEIILASSNDLQREIGIRKSSLLDVLNKLEKEKLILREGSGRGAKTYLLISEEEAYDFLKEYSPDSIR